MYSKVVWLYTYINTKSFLKIIVLIYGRAVSLLLDELFFSCSEQGLLLVVVHQLLMVMAPLVGATGSRRMGSRAWMGSVAPKYVGSSWTRSRICVSCLGRQIPYHWATRGAPPGVLSEKTLQFPEGSGLWGFSYQFLVTLRSLDLWNESLHDFFFNYAGFICLESSL